MRDLALWLAYALLVPAWCGIVALAIEIVQHRRGRGARGAWVVAILFGVGVPIWIAVRPDPPSFVAAREVMDAVRQRLPTAGPYPAIPMPPRLAPIELSPPRAPLVGEQARQLQMRRLRARWALGILLGTFGAVALWFAVGVVRLALLRRKKWHPTRVDRERVWMTDHVGPAVLGLWRPIVVIPWWVLDLPPDARRTILRHEWEHIAEWDAWMRTVGLGAILLMPWNPAVWWLVRRLQESIELDCDARVVTALGDPRSYVSVLLSTLERIERPAPRLLAMAPPRGMLSRRIQALIAHRAATPIVQWQPALLLAVAIFVGAVALCIPLIAPEGSSLSALASPPVGRLWFATSRATGLEEATPRVTVPVNRQALATAIKAHYPHAYWSEVPPPPIWISVDEHGEPRAAGSDFPIRRAYRQRPDYPPPCAGRGPFSHVQRVDFPVGTLGRSPIIVCQEFELDRRIGAFFPSPEVRAFREHLVATVRARYPDVMRLVGDPTVFIWIDSDRSGHILSTGLARTYPALIAHETPGADLRTEIRFSARQLAPNAHVYILYSQLTQP